MDTNVDVQSFVSAERFASLHAVNINGSEPSSEAVHGIKYRWMKVPEGISPCPAHHVLDESWEKSQGGKCQFFLGYPLLPPIKAIDFFNPSARCLAGCIYETRVLYLRGLREGVVFTRFT